MNIHELKNPTYIVGPTYSPSAFIIGASLSEPQGVMKSTALACVHAYLLTYVLARHAWERVKSVGCTGNECSLGSDGTSAEG